MSKQILHNDWHDKLSNEFTQPYYQALKEFLVNEYQSKTIYPPMDQIYNALHFTPFADVKVVILGQDPYHGPDQAHGLSFSVQKGVKLPPSLRNIFKELQSDLGYVPSTHGFLKEWSDQGVLLLNTTLTVRAGEAASHYKKGWEQFTDKIIISLNEKQSPIVYILWGKHAQSKKALIDTDRHFVIESVHPSPLSAAGGFFGSKPFSQTNELLVNSGQAPIDWEIKN